MQDKRGFCSSRYFFKFSVLFYRVAVKKNRIFEGLPVGWGFATL